MDAVLGGSGAALAFALSTMCSARSSRVIGPSSALAWVALLGLLITLPFAAASSVPSGISLPTALWLLASGTGNALGLLFAYRGLRAGKVGVVGPILSAEGAVAALV